MKKKIPAWKIQRELVRVGRQIVGLPPYLFEYLTTRPYYDLVQSKRRQISAGHLPLEKHAAVYLIYPSRGIQKSHLVALDHLTKSGYAPIVVSNLPLSPEDRARVVGLCHVLIERPNVGYDFGGYRDGVLYLRPDLGRLERLVLVNDSVWFPMPGAYDWLPAAEQNGAAFVGAIWAWAVPYPAPEHYQDISWTLDKNRRHFHYASFALSISKEILRDRGFVRFWQKLRLTSSKTATVRRGEMGLTRWVVRRGYSHAATTELTDLPDLIAALPDSELRLAYDRLISVTDPLMVSFRKRFVVELDAGRISRAQLEKMVICSVARQGASYAIADLLLRRLAFPFLKKSPCTTSAESAAIMLQIAQCLDAEHSSVFSQEMIAAVRSRKV